jgi:CBS domain-containing protein
MRCEEIMKREIKCVAPEDTVQSAARRMRDEAVGFLPVCDRGQRVLGTVTDRDLTLRVLADARAASTPIEDVFTPDVVACSPEDDLEIASELMAENHKSRIMCLDDTGRLVGVISLSDIAQYQNAGRVLRNISEREVRAS